MGAKRLRLRAEGPPPFIERDFFGKVFCFCKSINFVLNLFQCNAAKGVFFSCVEIYSCQISVVVRNRFIPDHSISD